MVRCFHARASSPCVPRASFLLFVVLGYSLVSLSQSYLLIPSPLLRSPVSILSSPRHLISSINRMEQDMDRMFDSLLSLSGSDDEFFSHPLTLRTKHVNASEVHAGSVMMPLRPQFDIQSTKEHMLVSVVTPGLSRENVSVEVVEAGGTGSPSLLISGRTSSKMSGEGGKIQTSSSSSFEKRISLPPHTTPEMVEARFEEGVLKVTVKKPKEQQESLRHKIPLL
ncbi:hypothetical protein GUITHDRAFT_155280 [Guillardia theta CCMP2712]|uniref:SHSP domain-containing protein n=1 Tax=Guillardia theta (strain CCMP2712) TaxID=905079 RepID=L1IJ82_GUITC|nr:hypothetical protein GUITHDRAFT_155280 [Guillardia theta CCMP2712]EKX36298.1 hypothetical protein GUITHDRAFT_155280 [Guillardia theta CCMP2712]|mmetsp:Transcript_6758/g.23750  ORF Transcript_6758/g.23750 Transcript_6758/m.23750 type:complete len:224 (-) Transcript_6758:85-756(-)|eukprot:XP_005823278.1 hypothetical protein GUITHDRAFT_155280 [Guillardia theta CCMP2712]